MKRFGRWLLDGRVPLVAWSVITVLAIDLLIAGYWRFDDHGLIDYRRGGNEWMVQAVTSHGGLGIDINHWWQLGPADTSIHCTMDHGSPGVYPDYGDPRPAVFNWYFLGFQLRRDDYIGSNCLSFVVPECLLLLACIPIIAHFWRGRRKFSPECCTKCGYDLRATPDRCPECGTIPADRERISAQN